MSINCVSITRCHWLVVQRADGPLRVLITDDPNSYRFGKVLPVFGHEQEARKFLELGDLDAEAWQIRMVGPGELTSLLSGLYRSVKFVALDPLTATTPTEIRLQVDYTSDFTSRGNFVEHLLCRAVHNPDDRRPATGPNHTAPGATPSESAGDNTN